MMKKLIEFLQSIHIFIYRSSRRFREQNEPFNFCDKLLQVKKVLVLMPTDPDVIPLAAKAVQEMRSLFPGWIISVCVDNAVKLPAVRNVVVIRKIEKDRTFYFLPKKRFLKNLFSSPIDMTIDLDQDWNFENFVITWSGHSELRIGFYAPGREDFYNFLVRQNQKAGPEHGYQLLLHMLKSL